MSHPPRKLRRRSLLGALAGLVAMPGCVRGDNGMSDDGDLATEAPPGAPQRPGLGPGAHGRVFDRTGRRVTFEWALIAGVNDTNEQARALSRIARGLRAHVNLIPLNPTPGYPTIGSSKTRVAQFHQLLVDLGVNATVRRNRGTDIDAACGQLRLKATQ